MSESEIAFLRDGFKQKKYNVVIFFLLLAIWPYNFLYENGGKFKYLRSVYFIYNIMWPIFSISNISASKYNIFVKCIKYFK